jgi:hypothetical protein
VSEWIVELDPANQQGKELREVYANAGVALNNAQTLEHVLKYFIVLAAAIEKRALEPPTSADDFHRDVTDLEKFEDKISKLTLGRLIDWLKSQSLLTQAQVLESDLKLSLQHRNRLVHHFLWDNEFELQSSDGRRRMAEELKRIQDQFKRTIVHFELVNKKLREYLRLPEEFIEKVLAAAKVVFSEEEFETLSRQFRESHPEKT